MRFDFLGFVIGLANYLRSVTVFCILEEKIFCFTIAKKYDWVLSQKMKHLQKMVANSLEIPTDIFTVGGTFLQFTRSLSECRTFSYWKLTSELLK